MGVRDMKNILKSAALALAFGIASLAAAGAEPVKVGFSPEAYPPFYSADASGNWTGWEVEIVHAICAEAKFECELTPIPWDGLIPALTTKKIDAIMNSMSITDERKKTIDFSDKYYNTPTAIVGPKSEKFGATPADLKGKIIGVQVSTTHSAYAKKHFTEAAEIKEYQTQDEANQDLAAGRIDGRFDRARRLPEIRAGRRLLRPQGLCRRRFRNPWAGRWGRRAQGGHGAQGKDQRRDQGHPRQRQI
jgi:polar amino acid transport system substrate-binding protein